MTALIVARAANNVIGCRGRIPWHIPGEQSQFRALTEGNCVIMGRRTYEEIGHPLKGRLNIVVSSTADFRGEGLMTVPTLRDALEAAGERDTFICGGAELYREALPLCDVLYITEICGEYEGDTYFPLFDPEDFFCTTEEREEGQCYTRTVYVRKDRRSPEKGSGRNSGRE